MYTLKGRYTSALITNDEIEEQCINQINNMINHIAFDNEVVLQVDAHAGKGSVVGFTMPLGRYLVPNTVGLDVSCGILCANIGKKLNMTFEIFDQEIRNNIPMGININENGFKINNNETFSFNKHFPWDELNDELFSFIIAYNKKFETNYEFKKFDYRSFGELCNKIGAKQKRIELSINSLGSGNHYYEVGISEKTDDVWISIHSGSRNFGKCICEYHQNKAKSILSNKRNIELKEKIEFINKNTQDKTAIPRLIEQSKKELNINFDFNINGMEFLEGDDAFEYLIDMVVAHKYAELNRKMMLNTTFLILGGVKPIEIIETVHNYIDFKDFIIRKGAIRSYIGEKMVVALNMKDGSLICEGKSNPDWNYSCGHGAGRKMSRSKAKETLDMDEFREQMKNIYSTSVCKGTLDECRSAYKNSEVIERLNEPTITVFDRLTPILNIKDKNTGPTFKERKEEKKKNLEREMARKLKEQNL
jgi:RNA-splicing ligase RtcB